MKMEVLEEEVETRAISSIAGFLQEREKIHKRFEDDPHVTEDPSRVQGTKMQRALNTKVDIEEFNKLDETKCNRAEMNTVGQKMGVIQSELSQLIVLFSETLKLNLVKA